MAHHDPAYLGQAHWSLDWTGAPFKLCARQRRRGIPGICLEVPGSSTRDKHRIHQKKFIISRYIWKKNNVEKFTKKHVIGRLQIYNIVRFRK